jgi:hypothetical protein
MIDDLDGIGDLVVGVGEVLAGAAEILQHAVWTGGPAPEKPEAGQAPAKTEEGPQDDRRAG